MFRNYFLTAWRHVFKNRLFSFINIFGLAVGLMSCMLIFLFVEDELSYDDWLPEGDRIVRLHSAFLSPDRPAFRTVSAPGFWMDAISAYAAADVETAVRLVRTNQTIIKDEKVFDERLVFADSTFFDIFKLPFVAGSAASAFSKPMDFIVSEEMALKYFGRIDVVGETLTVCCVQGQEVDVRVSGVIKDIPENSHLDIDFLVFLDPPMFDFAPNILKTWTSVNTLTYFKLKEGATVEGFKARVYDWLDRESPFRKMTADAGMDGQPSDFIRPNVMAVPDLHLHARPDAGNFGDMRPMGDIRFVYTFSAVAFLILAIACINFMNLSTARATQRAREVALRKVLGASRTQVALQFLGEAVMLSLIALMLGLMGVEMVLPAYNDVLGRSLEMTIATNGGLMALALGVAVLVGVIAGSYPALVLSRFAPARILKANKSSDAEGSGRLRMLLVVIQFAVSIGLAICTAVVYGQSMYAQKMDLGFETEGKIVMRNFTSAPIAEQRESIGRELAALPGVESVVFSSEVPTDDNENNTGFQLLSAAGDTSANTEERIINYFSVDFGFFEAYGIDPVAGRTFDRSRGNEVIEAALEDNSIRRSASVVINEMAARNLGFSNAADAVGRVLRAGVYRAGPYDLTIVGVVPDVHFRSIRFGKQPSVYFVQPTNMDVATVTYRTADLPSLVSAIGGTWRRVAPNVPMDMSFLNDMIAAQYADDVAQGTLFAAFSGLAILVACLGLYGLAHFTAERRTKEIGIRKVMGARTRDIVRLLVWQLSKPVVVANLIAWPVAWYLMVDWLQGFEYRLGHGYILVAAVVAGLVALLIAWGTVAGRAIRVASAKPIHALRYE
ncbi:ABC transporter permease [Pseudokordiimonas caeni]|uniref:ABC transporter permease n=1 Tax=Pseudokordiimonas caeni TaxID=2997908 RepID=UPI002811E36F|nr:ABC transporter permease [Pseudokordiimonas caeni]